MTDWFTNYAKIYKGAIHKWYPILGRGGRFSKIGESLCKKAFSIGGKSEIGGRGGQKWPQKIGYHLWTAPYLTRSDKIFLSNNFQIPQESISLRPRKQVSRYTIQPVVKELEYFFERIIFNFDVSSTKKYEKSAGIYMRRKIFP